MISKFGFKEIFSLLCIPLIFLTTYIANLFSNNTYILATIDTTLRIIIFVALIYVFKNHLLNQWKEFRTLKFYKWLIIIMGSIILQVIITISRKYLPSITSDDMSVIGSDDVDLFKVSLNIFLLVLYINIGPVVTSLIEDITFKYTLLERLLKKSVVYNIVLIIINSFLFGAIHYSNFGGHLINTIPFMLAGLFLNIIYIWTRNIWHVLLIHFFNNLFLTIFAMLIIGILRLMV